MTIHTKKTLTRADIRQLVRQKRRDISPQAQMAFSQQLSAQLQKRLSNLIQKNTSNKPINIALYLANDGELNPQPFIDWCWSISNKLNIHVYLPVIHPFSKGNLLFFNYTPSTLMIKNKFGILEPKLDITTLCSALDLDVLFTPLVAFDNAGNRLGMGGGFYDRTLAYIKDNENTVKSTQVIGLAHQCQEVEQLPVEAWDMPLIEVITPEKLIVM